MNEKKIAVVGYGFVGKSTAYALNIPEFDCYNTKNSDELIGKIQLGNYNTFIFCLPTPTVEGKQDLTAIEIWLDIIKNQYPQGLVGPVVVIRSTILPGTTKKLSEKYGLQIAHVPEFLTEATAISDEVDPEFVVIGADDILLREKVKKIFLDSKIRIRNEQLIECNSQTAEFIKYSLNSWFALKVIMGNQLWDIAVKVGADYNKAKEVLENHKWGSKNGWNVWHKNFRGYSGKCLPKDVEAFSEAFDMPLLKEVDRINKELTNN